MGSGHILVYAFDVFMDIYRLQGYTDQDAAQSIVRNNLYGLELDDRADQLAYFAVMMKARYYDRRFLTRGISPNLCAIQESNLIKPKYIELFGELQPIAQKLLDDFCDAKEYGSILNLSITADEIAQLETKYTAIINTDYDNMFDIEKQDKLRTLFAPLLKQAKRMVAKYDVVCTNPPYMGSSGMNTKLSTFVKKNYPDSKSDLFAAFIEKCKDYTVRGGYTSMITMHSWMFLSSFEKLREKLHQVTTVNMVHLGARAFDEISGEVVQTTAFVTKKSSLKNYLSIYKRLVDLNSENAKREAFLTHKNDYITSTDNFSKIPGSPIAYWVSENFIKIFDNQKTIDDISDFTGSQNITSKNEMFLRYFWEINANKIGVKKHWAFYAKGGEFRKWYGNNVFVVDTSSSAIHFYATCPTANYLSNRYWFQEGITYSAVTSKGTGFRYYPAIGGFDKGGATLCHVKHLHYVLALLNSKVVLNIFYVMNPTINLQVKDVKAVPVIFSKNYQETISNISINNIKFSHKDWDSFETSWDFKRHPLVRSCATVREAYNAWEQECTDRFNQLKTNEEELNRIFIDIYGLQDELTPEVEDKDVTVRKADLQRDIKSLISYAVGCMFGRYSLSKEGLIYAGGDFNDVYLKDAVYMGDDVYMGDGVFCTAPEYRQLKTDDGVIDLSFYPDYDNCIPITDTNYFGNADIISRFEKFVKIVYGEDTLEENLNFIANALGNNGKGSREAIRNYFLNGFFKDHCKIYRKRPIYWLFDSGKQNGFKALVYMHRWNADTIGNMRVEYLHRIQRTYDREIKREQDTIDNSTNKRDVAVATKRKEKLLKQLKESTEYDQKVAHLALSRINIDLDDGVKVNYEKVQTAKDRKKLQLLAKI